MTSHFEKPLMLRRVPRVRTTPEASEPMVDARTASAQLCIPLVWLLLKAQREARSIPTYYIGHLVRFRLSELSRWRDAYAEVIAPTPRCPNEVGDVD